METKTNFQKLSDRLNLMILSYLELQDFFHLSYMNSFFNRLISRNPCLFTREAIALYFPESIELFCEFTDFPEFNSDLKRKLERLSKTPTRFWKNKLKLNKDLKSSWLKLLNDMISGSEDVINSSTFDIKFLTDYIMEAVRSPNVLMPNLKRETVGAYCQTKFQNMLVEVLYMGPSMFSQNRLDHEILDFNQFFLDNQKEFENFHKKHGNNLILEARWYIYENMNENINFLQDSANEENMKNYQIEDDILEEDDSSITIPIKFLNNINFSNNENLLISIYNHLFFTFTNQASIIHQYLLQQDNPYDFVNEYCTRWNIYVTSIMNLEKVFKEYVNVLNSVYESLFENYPSFPKFSIWRMMSKIWYKTIYQRLEDPLTACFKKLLKVYRQKNMNNMINHKKIMLKKDRKDNLEEIPLPLYISFKNIKKKKSSFTELRFESAQFGYHEFFSSDNEHIASLLYNYLNSMMDLSLNEVNIHYLGHSELKFDYPYKSYERNIVDLTLKFYQDQYEMFYQTPELFHVFLEADFKHLCKIGNHKLNYMLEKIKLQAWIDFFKNWCLKQIGLESNEPHITEISLSIENKNKEVIQEILKENFEEILAKSEFYRTNGLFQESQELLKFSRMKGIKEEEEDSSLSSSKIDEIPKLKKSQVSVDSGKLMEMQEETLKYKTSVIYQAILEKFKGCNPYSIFNGYKEKLVDLKENKLPIDLEIEEINYSRKIPLDLGESAENFYNLSSDITKEFLIKMMKEGDEPLNGNSIDKSEEIQEEIKEEIEVDNLDNLPALGLNNYRSSGAFGVEIDRLGLRKEQSESCSSNKKD